MSMIDTEDIAAMKNTKDELLRYHDEWARLISEITDKEHRLHQCKEVYQALSEKIIADTDFKKLYGANNQSVRNNHVKHELSNEYDEIKRLEADIAYINRRIPYLKELIRTKRLLMELRE